MLLYPTNRLVSSTSRSSTLSSKKRIKKSRGEASVSSDRMGPCVLVNGGSVGAASVAGSVCCHWRLLQVPGFEGSFNMCLTAICCVSILPRAIVFHTYLPVRHLACCYHWVCSSPCLCLCLCLFPFPFPSVFPPSSSPPSSRCRW